MSAPRAHQDRREKKDIVTNAIDAARYHSDGCLHLHWAVSNMSYHDFLL
jgi:hypothetical protein